MNDKASPALIERLVKPGSGKFYLIGAALVLAAIIAYLAFGRSAPPRDDKPRGDGGGVREDDPIQSARVALSKSADLNSCRDVVAQVNRYLARQSARATSPLTRAEQEFLDGMTEAERQRLFEQSLPATAKDLPPDQARTQAFRFWFLKQHF